MQVKTAPESRGPVHDAPASLLQTIAAAIKVTSYLVVKFKIPKLLHQKEILYAWSIKPKRNKKNIT